MAQVARVPDLRQQVYEGLLENIRQRRYPTDARFLEHSVAKEFGVSRTPAREALALLVQDGLIVQQGRSFHFPKMSVEEITEVYEVRLRLEPFAARRAIECSTKAELMEVAAKIRHELSLHGESDSYVQANRRVRDEVFRLARNQRLVHAIQSQENYTHYIRTHTLDDPKTRAISVAGTLRLVEAMEDQDGEAAEIAMAQLLLAARRAILDHLSASTPSSDS
jgi:DNA-binding GntR family transcriptional regulator